MKRAAAAATLAAVLAGSTAAPGCAHGQLTNQQVAVGAVGVIAIVGVLALYGAAQDCKTQDDRCGDPK